MSSVIRKISIGSDYKTDAMHYSIGQSVYGGHTISHILSGRNKPSIDFLQKLLRVYSNLNANWLITGIGYMNTQKEAKQVKYSKKIGKVVVFYDDNSFDEVNS